MKNGGTLTENVIKAGADGMDTMAISDTICKMVT
jgi:hypothetical protein